MASTSSTDSEEEDYLPKDSMEVYPVSTSQDGSIDERDLSSEPQAKEPLVLKIKDTFDPNACPESLDVSDDSDSDDKLKSMYTIFSPYHVPGRHKLKNYAADKITEKTQEPEDGHDEEASKSLDPEGEDKACDGEDPHNLEDEVSDPIPVQVGIILDDGVEVETGSELVKAEDLEVVINKGDTVNDGESQTEDMVEADEDSVKTLEVGEGDKYELETDKNSESGDPNEVDKEFHPTVPPPIPPKPSLKPSPQQMESNTEPQINTSESGDSHKVDKEFYPKVPPPIPPKPSLKPSPQQMETNTEPQINTSIQPVLKVVSEPPPVKPRKSLSTNPDKNEEQLAADKEHITIDGMDQEEFHEKMQVDEENSKIANQNNDWSIKELTVDDKNDSDDADTDETKDKVYSIDEAMDIPSSENTGDFDDSKDVEENNATDVCKQTEECTHTEEVDDNQESSAYDGILITESMMADNSIIIQSTREDSVTLGYSFLETTSSFKQTVDDEETADNNGEPDTKHKLGDTNNSTTGAHVKEESIELFDDSDDEYQSADEGNDESDENDDSESDDSVRRFDDERYQYQTSLTEFSRDTAKDEIEDQQGTITETEDLIEACSDGQAAENESGKISHEAMSSSSRTSSCSSIVVLGKGSYRGDFKSISSKVSDGDRTGPESYDITETSEIEKYRQLYSDGASQDSSPPTHRGSGDGDLEMTGDCMGVEDESFEHLTPKHSLEHLVEATDNLTKGTGTEVTSDANDTEGLQGNDTIHDNIEFTTENTSISEESSQEAGFKEEFKEDVCHEEDTRPPPVPPKSMDVMNYIASMDISGEVRESPKVPPRSGSQSLHPRPSMPSYQPSAHRPATSPHYPNVVDNSLHPHPPTHTHDSNNQTGQSNVTQQQPYPQQYLQQQQQQQIYLQNLTPEQQQQYSLMMYQYYWMQYNNQHLQAQPTAPPESQGVPAFGQPGIHTSEGFGVQGQSPLHPTHEPNAHVQHAGERQDRQQQIPTEVNQTENTNDNKKTKADEPDSNLKHDTGSMSGDYVPPSVKHRTRPSRHEHSSTDEQRSKVRESHDEIKREVKRSGDTGRTRTPVGRSASDTSKITKEKLSQGQRSSNTPHKPAVPRRHSSGGKTHDLTDGRRTDRAGDSRKSTWENVRPKPLDERTEEIQKPAPAIPEECYLYISGLSPYSMKENLTNYLEARLGPDISVVTDKVIHDPTNGQALIVFSDKPDLERLFTKMSTTPIDGVYLKGQEVKSPTHIAVSSEGTIRHPENLVHYFENERIGNGEVTDPVRESEDGSCFILGFEDKKVVERVCKIECHMFDSHVLRVSPCYVYEGGAIWDHVIHVIPKAEPIEKTPPPEHYRYLKRCCSKELKAMVESCHGEVEMTDNSIRVTCSLTPKTPGFKSLIKAWPKDMSELVSTFVKDEVNEKDVCLLEEPEVWAKLVGNVIFTDEDNLNILQDNGKKCISLTGAANEVKRKYNETKQNIENIRRELRRKIEVKKFNAFKLAVLFLIGKIDEIQKRFNDAKITCEWDVVTVEGQPEDIQSVFVEIFEKLQNVTEEHIKHSYSRDCVLFVTQTKTVMSKIRNAVDSYDVIAEWELRDRELMVCCCKPTKPSEIATHVLSQIGEVSIDLDKETKLVLTTGDWTDFSADITESFPEAGHHQLGDTVVVYGYVEQVKTVVERVRTFLDENAVRRQAVKMDAVKQQFIVKHRLRKVKEDLKSLGVEIKIDGNILLTGKKDGISQAKQSLNKLEKDITSETHEIKKVGIFNVYESEKTKGTIDNIEQETSCLIKAPHDGIPETSNASMFDPDYDIIHDGGAVGGDESAEEAFESEGEPDHKELKCKNGIVISLVQGEIGNEAADVLVATCAPNLDLKLGGASKSLLDTGGPSLQQELRDNHKEIKHGELVEIKGGQLECSQVYLTSLPNWTSDGGCSAVIKKFITGCLYALVKKNKRSIMFSAMGTGQLKYPHAHVAQLMFQAVIEFDSKITNSSVEEVKFIMYPKDAGSIHAFKEELKCLKDGGKRPSFAIQFNNVHVEMVIEDIAAQKVDAILCSSSEDMDLSRSGAASALLKAGGKALQDGASAFKNNLKMGEVGKIAGGKLCCKSVFLTVLPSHSKDTEGVLSEVIQKFLNLSQLQGYTSVAMPAMGTGFLKYPKKFVSRAMIDAVNVWSVNNSGSSVTSVRFVMHAKDSEVIDAFKVQIKQRQGGVSPRKGRFLQRRSISRSDPVTEEKYRMLPSGCRIGDATLTVKVGDLVEEQTDAIVSSLGRPCEFLGAVAQVLTKRCPKLEERCQKKQAKFDQTGVICIKSGGGIPAHHIIHVHFQETLDSWQKHMFKCLEKANDKGFKSLAFPVLGTGAGNTVFKADEIAGCMFAAMDQLVSRSSIGRKLKLKDVRVVIYHKLGSMRDPFMAGLSAKANAALTGKEEKWYHKVKDKVTGFFTDKTKDKPNSAANTKLSTLSLTIYSDDPGNIKKCKDRLDIKLEEGFLKKTIDSYKDLVKSLKKEELSVLENISIPVNINIDQTNGVITIYGPLRYVSEADTALQTRLRKIEQTGREAEEAKTLYTFVKWHYEEITNTGINHEAYDERSNYLIETAYKNNKKSIPLEDSDGKVYVVDFDNMTEYPEKDRNAIAKVMRKDIIKAGSHNIPDTWAVMGDSENIKVVNIASSTKEYTDVESLFVKQAQTGQHSSKIPNVKNIKVSKIERIQNKTLFQQYMAKKKHIELDKPQLPANMPLEKSLWHGTNQAAVASIQRHGFNRSYCGRNGIWFGAGVYFAADASYSARPWLAQGQQTPTAPPGSNKGYIFLCKVLTGQYLKGTNTMRYLPPVDANKDKTLMYDSAVDDMNNPMEYVIFHDTQAYPEYIITFLL